MIENIKIQNFQETIIPGHENDLDVFTGVVQHLVINSQFASTEQISRHVTFREVCGQYLVNIFGVFSNFSRFLTRQSCNLCPNLESF